MILFCIGFALGVVLSRASARDSPTCPSTESASPGSARSAVPTPPARREARGGPASSSVAPGPCDDRTKAEEIATLDLRLAELRVNSPGPDEGELALLPAGVAPRDASGPPGPAPSPDPARLVEIVDDLDRAHGAAEDERALYLRRLLEEAFARNPALTRPLLDSYRSGMRHPKTYEDLASLLSSDLDRFALESRVRDEPPEPWSEARAAVTQAALDIVARDPIPARRRSAITLFHHAPPEEGPRAMMAAAAHDPDPGVREEAVRALGSHVDVSDVLPAVREIVRNDADAGPRHAAVFVLALDPAGVPFLQDIARARGDLGARREALEAVVKRLGREATGFLRSLSEDPEIGSDALDWLRFLDASRW